MKTNLSDADRTARMLIGAISGFLFVTQRVPGTPGLVLAIVSVYTLATAVLGWCLLYSILRISTHKPDSQRNA